MKIKMEDLLCFRFLSEPRFVSDHAALFTQTRPGDDQEGYCAQLKIVDLHSGETVWETEEGVSLGRPLDNSQIGFWKREEKNTVFYLEEIVSRRRTSLLTTPLKVLSFEFIDEHRLVALIQVDLEKPEDQPENGAEWEISDELPFLDNARGYVSKLRRSLFLFDLENGTSHRLTDEFFDTSFYALSQDARTLVFTGKSYQDIATNRDGVFACDLSSEAISTLVEPGIYRVYAAWRIRDKYYMSASLCDRYHASQNPDFYRIEPETGRMVKIAEPDVMVRGLGICSDCRYGGGRNLLTDGDDLYFTAVTMHNNNLYRMSPDGNLSLIHILRIFPSEDKRRLLIQVLDDGVGIPDEILRQLPDRYVPQDDLSRGGYALKNIYDRLSLKYPGAFRFQFFSEVKKYTRVEIELPLESPQDSDAL